MTEKLEASEADRVLAERVWREGDERAFRTLYRKHTPALYQFALRLLGGNEQEAEDVVQDTWVGAVEHLPDFRWEASFRTWLTGIALNLCRTLFRRKDRGWVTMSAGDEPTAAADPCGEVELLDLEAAIAALAPGYRTVLVLHDVEGFTHGEIAERLEVSANTSKSQLSRARRALRAALEGQTTTGVES